VRDFVAREWAALEKLGFAPGASQDRLRFTTDLVAALADADFVQENGPERIAFKIELFKQMDAATRPEVILASSSSTLAVTDMQSGCVHPERVVLAHPFNPPHLIPLVEIVGGERTSEAVVLEAAAFFQSLGKKTVCMRQAILGHIANRLQAALWQEAFNLIDKGVATVAEIDTAISYGPGVRWALLGPMMNLHLSGGEGGIGHLLDHLGPANESMWRDLGKVTVGPELRSKIVAQTAAMIGDEDVAAVLARRNDALLSLLQLKQAASLIP
jgi:3-hydroxyacyl-CoA dehydrogenase